MDDHNTVATAATATSSSLSSSTVIPIQYGGGDDNDDSSNSHDLPHWTLIEVNGELLPPKEMCSSNSFECELGSIWFDNDNVPVMIIGSHELRGSIETLAQPFCVLEKQQQQRGDNSDSASSYSMRGIIDRKLVFRQYPKTLIR